MARPELGTKRVCPVTGRKFYDLNRDPIISPYTGQVVTIAAALPRVVGAAPSAASDGDADGELAQPKDVELISLEEADDEADGAKDADDIEIEDDGGSDENTFLEEDEDSNDDVTDLIGDGIEDDEEQ